MNMDDNRLTEAIESALRKDRENRAKIQRWETERRRRRLTFRRLAALSTAAVLIAAIGVTATWMFNSGSHDEPFAAPAPAIQADVYRSSDKAIPEIDRLIEEGNLSDALFQVRLLESRYTSELKSLTDIQSPTEEQSYEKAVAEEMAYNIGWRKIKLLLALDSTSVAKPLVREYCFKIGPHQSEAHKIWRQLD